MTLSEFKAWFEGYTEGLESAPTKAQFDRIKEKVKEITGTPVTYPVFVERYLPRVRQWAWNDYNIAYAAAGVSYSASLNVGNAVFASDDKRYEAGQNQTIEFNPQAAMYALGKADAAAN